MELRDGAEAINFSKLNAYSYDLKHLAARMLFDPDIVSARERES